MIRGLIKFIFILFLMIGIVFAAGYFFRRETKGLESFVKENVMIYILPDTTGQGMALDSTLTPLEELQFEIDQRQEQLSQRSFSLDSLQIAINDSMAVVQTIRDEIIEQKTLLDEQENTNLDKLAKLYEGIKAEEAAPILLQLPDQTVAEILYRMKDRPAAKILGAMDPLRAADLTVRLRRLAVEVRTQ